MPLGTNLHFLLGRAVAEMNVAVMMAEDKVLHLIPAAQRTWVQVLDARALRKLRHFLGQWTSAEPAIVTIARAKARDHRALPFARPTPATHAGKLRQDQSPEG